MSEEFHFAKQRPIPGWGEDGDPDFKGEFHFAKTGGNFAGLGDGDPAHPGGLAQKAIDGMKRDKTPFHFVGDPRPKPADTTEFRFAKSSNQEDAFAGLGSVYKGDTSGFHFAGYPRPELAEPYEFHFAKSLQKSNLSDCSCGGSCTDCSKDAVAKLQFKAGQKLRHVKSGQIYEFIKTLCRSPEECYAVARKRGKETEILIYPGEVELVAA